MGVCHDQRVSSVAVETGLGRRAHHLPAAGAALVAVVLLAGAPQLLGEPGRLAAVLVLQVVLVAVWVLATGPGGAVGPAVVGTAVVGTAVVGVAAAVGADLALELPDRPGLGGLLVVLGPAFLAVVLAQVLRRHRQDMVAALSRDVLLVCAVSALAVFMLVGPATAVLVVGAALVVEHLVDLLLPRPALAPGVPRGPLGLLAGVAAGTAVAFLLRDATGRNGGVPALAFGAILGGGAGLVAVAASYVVVERGPVRGRLRTAASAVLQALLPIAACAPLALALETALRTGL
jgi:hypothetical protein